MLSSEMKDVFRLKELIVTAGGENVPPVPIEESIKRNCEDLLSNVIVVGDKRKFLSCFVTLKVSMVLMTSQYYHHDVIRFI